MGNNLCATWQKAGYDWSLKKDTHLIRLWAEIFEVREDSKETYWGRVSDDVVPVNVAFVQNMAETTFQLTAYNRLVEKIFDVYLIQPGTRIIQATDCFVHWRDSKQSKEWGLNFTTPSDARKFRECCTSRIYLSLPKKATTATTTDAKKPNSNLQQQQQQHQQQNLQRPLQPQLSPSHSRCHHHATPRRVANSKDEMSKVDTQKLYGTLPNTASSKATQQNRQSMSVYLDNRCCCGLDYQQHQQQIYNNQEKCAVHSAMVQTSQQQRQYFSQNQHTFSGIYGSVPVSAGEIQRRCCRCSMSQCNQHGGQCNADHANVCSATKCGGQNLCVYQRYSFRQQQQQQQQQQHICQQNQCCRAALEDNLINYGIYLSVQEANRLKEMERSKEMDRSKEISPTSPLYHHHHHQDSRNNSICRSCCSKTSSDGECSKNVTFANEAMITPPVNNPAVIINNNNNNNNDNLMKSETDVENGNKLSDHSDCLKRASDIMFQCNPQEPGTASIQTNINADRSISFSSSIIENSSFTSTSIMIISTSNGTATANRTHLSTFTTKNSFTTQEATVTTTFQSHQRQLETSAASQQSGHVSKDNLGTKMSSQQMMYAAHPLINWPPPPPPPRQTLPLKRIPGESIAGPSTITNTISNHQIQFISENQKSTNDAMELLINQTKSENDTISLLNLSPPLAQELPITDLVSSPFITPSTSFSTFQRTKMQDAKPQSSFYTDKSLPASIVISSDPSCQSVAVSSVTTFTEMKTNDTSEAVLSDGKAVSTASKHKLDQSQKPAIKAKPQQYYVDKQIKENNEPVRITESDTMYKEKDNYSYVCDKESKLVNTDQDSYPRSSLSSPPKEDEDLMDGTDWSEVRRFNTSDISGSECGGDDDDDIGDIDDDDDDDDDSSDSGSIRTVPSQDSLVSKSTVVRRSGYLAAKNWLVHHKKKTEMAQKRSWKKYRVCLKGNVLWFYEYEPNDQIARDGVKSELPKHKLVIESCLVQPFPDHPKKEFVFSLSTAFGDAYLFQASSQSDMDRWICAIHSACAASLARQHGRENTLKLLRNEVHRIKNSIELDIKMRKMASLHLATVTDQRSRQAIEKQMNQWEENLEKLYLDQHRLKCYTSSLQGVDLPNSKALMGCISRQTKSTLARIGVLTATTFHAAVCARQQKKEAGLASSDVLCGGLHKQYCPLSSFKVDENNQVKVKGCAVGTKYGHSTCQLSKLRLVDPSMTSVSSPNFVMSSIIKVMLSNNQHVSVEVNDKTTVRDVIEAVCGRSRLNPSDHFLRMHMTRESYRVPDKMVFIQSETNYEFIELCQKLMFQVELQRNERERDLGIRVEAELADDVDQEDELCLFISEITKDGLAYKKGLSVGDEILVINGDVVSRLDMVHIEGVLQDSITLLLTIRSCSIERSPYLHPDIKLNAYYGVAKTQQGISDTSRGNPTGQSTRPHYCPHHFNNSSPDSTQMSSQNPLLSVSAQLTSTDSKGQGCYPQSADYSNQSNSYIEKMICPPPPSFMPMSDKRINDLIVPEPNIGNSDISPDDIPDLLRTKRAKEEAIHDPVNSLLKGASKVNHICQLSYGDAAYQMESPSSSSLTPPPPRPLSNAQHTCKVVMELIDTEKHYIRDLISLIERYLEPLRDEMLLSGDDIDQLFGNIRGIVQFQKLFLTSLEEAIETIPNFDSYHQNASNFREEDLRRVLTLIGSSFMYYAHHFKLYSSFCASHSKAQKMISCEDNSVLQEFLRARNPKQQHSSTIESFLIKPIQRILKYPLLLKQLVELTQPQSDEHLHLKDALHAMEAVAEHINEMQKIYEEYGAILEELVKQHKQFNNSCSKMIDLNVGELHMYGTVNWINPLDEIGKIKKDYELLTLVFIFKTAVVILAQERPRPKKKGKLPPSTRISLGGFPVECTRFKLAIPVDQLQVRTLVGDTNDKHGLWEIVHCRSEREGRPKKVFQFISSHKARNDFIRTIHHTMHESIRRSSSSSSSSKNKLTLRHPGHYKHPLSINTSSSEVASASKQSPSEAGCKSSRETRLSSAGEPSANGLEPPKATHHDGKTISQTSSMDSRAQLQRNFR